MVSQGKDNEAPPSFKNIWEGTHCVECEEKGKSGWKCLWCGQFYQGRHHTRAVFHFAQMKGKGIAVCKAAIPGEYAVLYVVLFDLGSNKGDARHFVSIE